MSSFSLYDLQVSAHAKYLLEEKFCKNCKYFVFNSDGIPWYNHCLENLERIECILKKEICQICKDSPACQMFHLCRRYKDGISKLSINYMCDEYERCEKS